MLHTITGLALETFIVPVELLNASYEKGANLKVAIGAEISDSEKRTQKSNDCSDCIWN